MDIFGGIKAAFQNILWAKSAALTHDDFFDPEDFNGASPFFRRNAKSPSDFYTGWWHTGISTIANHLAVLDRVIEDSKGNVVKNNPIMAMMDFEFLRDFVSFLEIHGRSYIWKVTTPGSTKTILGLEVLNPLFVEEVRLQGGNFGIKEYKYKYDNKTWTIAKENMIVVTYFHPVQSFPYNKSRGMSGLAASDFAIDADRSSDIYNANFFENGWYAGNILSTDKELTPEVAKRILDKWNRDHKSIKNGHQTALLSHGIKANPNTSQKDMDFAKMKEVARDVILGRTKVPKAVLGMSEGVNVGNVVAFDRIFSRRTIQPIAILIQEAFNRHLFDGVGKFRFINVVPTDVDEILRLYAIGMLTKNQALIEIWYDPIGPDGDVYITSPFDVGTPSAGNQWSGDTSVPKSIDVSMEACTKLSKSIIEGLKKKSSVELQSDEWMEKDWQMYIKRNDKYEADFSKAINKVFKKQEEEIISEMQKSKEYSLKAKTPKLGSSDWFAVYYLSIYGVLEGIMKEEGKRANVQIGLQAVFGVPQKKVTEMIVDQVKKLQLSVDGVTNEKIANAIANADNNAEAVKAVREVFDELSSSRVKMISRSETVRAANDATIAQWKETKQVASKIWYTVQDERTCEFCGAMHGKKVGLDVVFFKKGDILKVTWDDGFVSELPLNYEDTSGPPLHPNCRCRLKAVLIK